MQRMFNLCDEGFGKIYYHKNMLSYLQVIYFVVQCNNTGGRSSQKIYLSKSVATYSKNTQE